MIASIIVGVVVGLLTGVGAAWTSLWQNKMQRLWEKKENDYLDILNVLQVMRRLEQHRYDEFINPKDEDLNIFQPDQEDLELDAQRRREWLDAKARMERHADLGSVLTSPETEEILKRLKGVLDRGYDNPFDEVDEHLAAIKTALDAVKHAAAEERGRFPIVGFRRSKL